MSEEEILLMINDAFEQHLFHAHDQDRPTLRDNFAMSVLPALMARYQEHGYTEHGAVAEAYSIADIMLSHRTA